MFRTDRCPFQEDVPGLQGEGNGSEPQDKVHLADGRGARRRPPLQVRGQQVVRTDTAHVCLVLREIHRDNNIIYNNDHNNNPNYQCFCACLGLSAIHRDNNNNILYLIII